MPKYLLTQNRVGTRSERTLVVVNDDVLRLMCVHGLSAAAANYKHILLPSYLKQFHTPSKEQLDKIHADLKAAGAPSISAMPPQNRLALILLVSGSFDERVTIIGISDLLQDALRRLYHTVEDYEYLRHVNLTTFHAMDGEAVVDAFLKDQTVRPGSDIAWHNGKESGSSRTTRFNSMDGNKLETIFESEVIEHLYNDLNPIEGKHRERIDLQVEIQALDEAVLRLLRRSNAQMRRAIVRGDMTLSGYLRSYGYIGGAGLFKELDTVRKKAAYWQADMLKDTVKKQTQRMFVQTPAPAKASPSQDVASQPAKPSSSIGQHIRKKRDTGMLPQIDTGILPPLD